MEQNAVTQKIGHSQIRRQPSNLQNTRFSHSSNLAPALCGLAHPVLDGQEPLLATGSYANNHKGAELVILAPKAAVDAVSPDIDDRLVIQRSLSPAVVLFAQSRLSRETVFADSPAASGPRRTLRAAPISPLEIAFEV